MTAFVVVFIAAVFVGVSNWVAAVENPGAVAGVLPEPRPMEPVLLEEPNAEDRRLELLRRAAIDVPPATAKVGGRPTNEPLSCWFVPDRPSGTTPKFGCVLDNGELVKVKYGREPEIHAEIAATRLLRMLGYAADDVVMVRQVRCYGCPRYPFAGSFVLTNALTRRLLVRADEPAGHTDFEWVSVEHRFPAPPIETSSTKGWTWWELNQVTSEADPQRRADVDALRLLAAFLAHWDNKSENQRLVCLDEHPTPDCERPLALIQDLGATFGPMKVNLARWRDLPVWHDRAMCLVSMRALPYRGASYPDAVISEAGRAQLAARFAKITDADVRELFSYARFPEYQSATDDEKDLDAWVGAFNNRVTQIRATGPCPT